MFVISCRFETNYLEYYWTHFLDAQSVIFLITKPNKHFVTCKIAYVKCGINYEP